MIGWLVNDCLTCIPGTKTFWHDLLEHVPGLIDKTGGYTAFSILPDRIENLVVVEGLPNYLIRNATFFRRLNLSCPQISFLQDCYDSKEQQIDVCNNSAAVVCNSNYVYEQYKHYLTTDIIEIIPIGIDFNLFKPLDDKDNIRKQLNILPNSILYVGSSANYPKGFNFIMNIVNSTNYNFCFVMKDSFNINHPRIKIFNKVNHNLLVKIYNSCELLLCTSVIETLHLAGIEAAACNLPLLTTNVGIYYNLQSGVWGINSDINNFVNNIKFIIDNKNIFSPREYFIGKKFDKKDCMNKWINLINNIMRKEKIHVDGGV